MTATRRLAAILAADVVGYSRLIELDEAGTLAALRERRKKFLDPTVARHQGRIVKVMGDGVLVEFASAVNAVACAVELQKQFAAANEGVAEDRRIVLRIGVNLGDVVVEGGDLYGDGVIIAVRLETMAEPGGICISGSVHEQVAGKLDAAFDDLGPREVKNSSKPVRVFRLTAGGATPARPVLVLPDKPSIAVLAFQNMSGDAEQEYFADGVVEEIITALSRMHWLFVVARNSSFSYKGRAVDVKQIGRELGVRYVLEGSIRRAGGKLRITAQLIDAATGAHLWAERYDGAVEDVFDLQDQVTASVVGAIAPKLELAEIELAKRKPTTSLDAYDHYLRGLACLYEWTAEANNEALSHFYRAIELDPGYAAAQGCAARCFAQRKVVSTAPLQRKDVAEAERLARRAAELGRNDDIALAMAGMALGYVVGDIRGGMALEERALAINPNLAIAWHSASWMKNWDGQSGAAIEYCRRAIHLSPQDPMIFQLQACMAHAHFAAGHYEEALSWAQKALNDRPDHPSARIVAAASLAHLGRQPEAVETVRRMLKRAPALNLRQIPDLLPYAHLEHLSHWIEGLRQAGLPE